MTYAIVNRRRIEGDLVISAVYTGLPTREAADAFNATFPSPEFNTITREHPAHTSHPTRVERAEAALRAIRSIGARSGTDLNAWNRAFEVIDEALSAPVTSEEN